jgi:para-aminobenzoate synthetase component 1
LEPLRAAAALPRAPGRVLLHSGVDADGCGRYSFLADQPACVLEARGQTLRLWRGQTCETVCGDPLERLERLGRDFGTGDDGGDGRPIPVAIGTLSYDFGRRMVLGARAENRPTEEPDLWFGFYESVARWDHATGDFELLGPHPSPRLRGEASRGATLGPLVPADDASCYRAGVEQILAYLRAGDCYQVNLGRRLHAEVISPGDPLVLYESLARVSPAPYGALIDRHDSTLLSGSQEGFLFRGPGSARI